MAFRHQGEMVFQLQLTRSVCAVPITRSYMLADEMAARVGRSESA